MTTRTADIGCHTEACAKNFNTPLSLCGAGWTKARESLLDVLGRFKEGFDTANLREAKALLAQPYS
jgi:hypothetical protein